jgi:hypothetical protein
MAELLPGFVSGTFPASVLRMIETAGYLRAGTSGTSAQVQARSGILGHKSLRVTASSGRTLAVSSGSVLLQGSTSQQGAYILVNSADDTVQLDTADTSFGRKDAVIARVYDTSDGVSGNGNQWIIDKVTGNPAASPALPSLPTDSILLAEVAVAANASTITAGNITDRRVYTVALGGVLPCLSTALPADPSPGQAVWLTDINALDVFDGSAYQRLYRPRVWTELTLTSAYANYGGTYANLGYTVTNNVLSLRGVIKSTVSTSAAATIATLPAGVRPTFRVGLQIAGPAGAPNVRVDIFPTGIISDQVAHGAYTSMLFDNVNIPLG